MFIHLIANLLINAEYLRQNSKRHVINYIWIHYYKGIFEFRDFLHIQYILH